MDTEFLALLLSEPPVSIYSSLYTQDRLVLSNRTFMRKVKQLNTVMFYMKLRKK